jgi:phosphoenolpyruvate synthase/pyruvate phosphate dikinase
LATSPRRDGPEKQLPALLHRVGELNEFNPMLGHRGCRLGVTYPEITEMQARNPAVHTETPIQLQSQLP